MSWRKKKSPYEISVRIREDRTKTFAITSRLIGFPYLFCTLEEWEQLKRQMDKFIQEVNR